MSQREGQRLAVWLGSVVVFAALVASCSETVPSSAIDALESTRVACIWGQSWTDPELGTDIDYWWERGLPEADLHIRAAVASYEEAVKVKPVLFIPVFAVQDALHRMRDAVVEDDMELFVSSAAELASKCDLNWYLWQHPNEVLP